MARDYAISIRDCGGDIGIRGACTPGHISPGLIESRLKIPNNLEDPGVAPRAPEIARIYDILLRDWAVQ